MSLEYLSSMEDVYNKQWLKIIAFKWAKGVKQKYKEHANQISEFFT